MDNSKRTDTELPDVLTILTSLGIELPQRINQSNIEIRCPFCDDKKHHLRFSLENEKYYCPRCNASGNILTFYAQMRNISNKEAHKELLSQEFGAATASIPRREFEQVKTAPLAPIAQRHAVYLALLNLLSLEADHRQDLLDRGLTEEQIKQYGFKSMPVGKSYAIPRELIKKGFSLEGIPGFYTDKSGNWKFRCKDSYKGRTYDANMTGYLIPVLDSYFRIQGFQIRREKGATPKYIWLSSIDLTNGCAAKSWCHYVGAPLSSGRVKQVLLTEGALKADVINALSGRNVLALMGVNATSGLEHAISRLKKSGVEEVLMAFDMDMKTNPNVKRAFKRVHSMLTDKGLRVKTLTWPEKKGLDDFLLFLTKNPI